MPPDPLDLVSPEGPPDLIITPNSGPIYVGCTGYFFLSVCDVEDLRAFIEYYPRFTRDSV